MERKPQPIAASKSEVKPSTLPVLLKAGALTTLMTSALYGAALAGGIHAFGGSTVKGDAVSEAAQLQRQQAFVGVDHLALETVADSQVDEAANTMQLSTDDRTALLSQLSPPAAAPAISAATPVASQASAPSPAVSPSSPSSPPATQAAAAPAATPLARLAWITLWDTDAEDGDVVRLQAGGYTRTIVLAKQPVSFAIPVPQDGMIQVTGIHDGEGGGITVGLASGASQVVFPIMSEGQTLNLRVRPN